LLRPYAHLTKSTSRLFNLPGPDMNPALRGNVVSDQQLPLSNKSRTGIVDDLGERTVRVIDLCALQAEPIFPGQHEVEHDKTNASALERPCHRPPIMSDRDSKAVLCQEIQQQHADFPGVIDDEQMRRDLYDGDYPVTGPQPKEHLL
jgi:hypothetical protein